MPELPEVETTRRGIQDHVTGRTVVEAIVRNRALRWPVTRGLGARLRGQRIGGVDRRAKYLLLRSETGTLIVHLGMSGSLRIVTADAPPEKHDHVDLVFEDGRALRFRDPRRFGAMLWTSDDPLEHKLLAGLGPEPFEESMDGDYLYETSRGRRTPLRNFLLDSRVVVGVGNIYANEAAFRAGIRPARAAGRIARSRYVDLAGHIKDVLAEAIEQGGTTLRDFVREDGQPGYFRISLQVYGREGEPCRRCGATIVRAVVGARSTFYCPQCQS